jgi:hypothetical protein
MQLLFMHRGHSDVVGALVAALIVATLALSGTLAQAASWHLDTSFGKHGIAGLPVREGGYDQLYGPGPGDQGVLLAAGPQGRCSSAATHTANQAHTCLPACPLRASSPKALAMAG